MDGSAADDNFMVKHSVHTYIRTHKMNRLDSFSEQTGKTLNSFDRNNDSSVHT